MLTTLRLSCYRLSVMFLVLLAACSARPVLHEFPPVLALEARPPAVVNYTLKAQPEDAERWELLGGQGATVGKFLWQRAFREPEEGGGSIDRSEDMRRDDRVIDDINQNNYVFRVSATSGRLRDSSRAGTAPPRLTVFNAKSGERVGDLELRVGFDHRVEGIWRGRSILWRVELIRGGVVERETEGGKVEHTYPTSQLMYWTGGFDAGLKVYVGREVKQARPPEFGSAFFDITADRPLTRTELGDVVVLVFAIRSLQEFAGLTNM